MNANRIGAWLRRAPAKGVRLQLVYQSISGNEVVCAWDKEALAGDAGQLVYDAAQDHCDDLAQSARYSMQWLDETETVIATKVTRCVPDEDEDTPAGASKVEDATQAGVLGQVLRHNEAMTRMYVGAMGGVLGKMHDLLNLQSAEIKSLNQKLRARADIQADAGGASDAAESEARAAAIVKVADAISDHLVPYIAQRMSNGAGH